MEDIIIKEYDEAFIKIDTSKSIENEIQEKFSFKVSNAKFNPKYRNGSWDGTIKLFNKKNKTLYKGLVEELISFSKESNYSIKTPFRKIKEIDRNEIIDFLKEIKVNREPRDYQIDYMKSFIDSERAVLLSPTSSGKSFMLYGLIRWYNVKTLVVVPTVGLVSQMQSDFKDYTGDGWNVDENTHTIIAGVDKNVDKSLVISTWQSIYQMPPDWFQQFQFVIVDECHSAKAVSLQKIMEMCRYTKLRLGTTGTLDGIDVNEMTIKGLFGPIIKHVSTADLMEMDFLSNLSIKSFIFDYNKESKKMCGKDYDSEIDFIVGHKRRNSFIIKLANKLKGNVLIFYQYVDKQGKILYDLSLKEVQNSSSEKKVYFIHGGTKPSTREEYRVEIDKNQHESILISSYGTTSTGINIVNIDHIIFAHPTKSLIRVLQSIGRGLRKGGRKEKVELYDLSDNLSRRKGHVNHTYRHFLQRLKIYNVEGFEYKTKMIKIENDS